MVIINCIESKIEKPGNLYSYLILESFDVGHGITVANSLRRCMLADLYGCAIKGVRINNLRHEFGYIAGVKEEPLEILMNLKGVILGKNFSFYALKDRRIIRGFLNVKGPIVVTAGMLKLPKDLLKIFNPRHYICTILNNSDFYLEIDIATGKGCNIISYDSEINYKRKKKFFNSKGSTLLLDTFFNPVRSANYKIKLINDKVGILKESLHFEIITNQTITPYRVILEATKSLLNLFMPILITENFIKINLEIKANFYSLNRYKDYKRKAIKSIFKRILRKFFLNFLKIQTINTLSLQNNLNKRYLENTNSVTLNDFKKSFNDILIKLLDQLKNIEENLEKI